MALTTVQNFALMVVILAVVLVIFFAIQGYINRAFASLEKDFGNAITEGKALHVSADGSEEIWEFHITNGETTDSYPDVFDVAQNPSLKGKLVHTAEIIKSNPFYENFFILQNPPPDKCLLFITREEYSGGYTPLGYIYYINPGTTIQDGCGSNLKECIDGGTNWEGCLNLWTEGKVVDGTGEFSGKFTYVGYCVSGNCPIANDIKSVEEYCGYDALNKNKFNSSYYLTKFSIYSSSCPCLGPGYLICPCTYDICSLIDPLCEENQEVENMAFTETKKYDWMEKCGDVIRNRVANEYCNLLVREDNTYQVKYGLVCDSDGKWQVCTEKRENAVAEIGGGATVTCQHQSGTDFLVWQ